MIGWTRIGRRDVRAVLKPFMPIGGGNDLLSEFSGPFTPKGRRQLAMSKILNFAIGGGEPLAKAHDQGFDVADQSVLLGGAKGLDDGLQDPDCGLELLEAFALRGRDADCERTDAFREVIAQDGQGRLAVRDDEHALPCRHCVANDVRDRMRLPGARWTLNYDAVGALEAAHDLDLLVVERLGEK